MKADGGTGSLAEIISNLGSLKQEQGNGVAGVFIDETLREFFYLDSHI